ncbi:MAG TPA: preprotein translocase subunit SecG [Opitutaceae bacterium]
MSILIGIVTFILILVSIFMVLVVLAQKAKSDGGVGAAMGGGMAEATFGAETGNVLTKATINAAIAFFILSFLLYLGHIYQRSHGRAGGGALPTINAPATTTPAPEAAAPNVTVPTTPAPATTDAATPPAEQPKEQPKP